MSGMQASEERATRNGIQALELAFSGVTRCVAEVESTGANLRNYYGGSDGGAYNKLLEAWQQQGVRILNNLQAMIEELNKTLVEHGKAQGAANEAINEAYSRSDAVFDALVL